MKITKDKLNEIIDEIKNNNQDNEKLENFFSLLFKPKPNYLEGIKVDDKDLKKVLEPFITYKENSLEIKIGHKTIQNIIAVYELEKLSQYPSKASEIFSVDSSGLNLIKNEIKESLNDFLNKDDLKEDKFNNQIEEIIKIKFYPAYRKFKLKEFLYEHYERIAIEADIFDSYSSKFLSFMEGPFFWGIVENQYEGKKYYQDYISEAAIDEIIIKNNFKQHREEDNKEFTINGINKHEIHKEANETGSGLKLDHIIPRAVLRIYFEKLCCDLAEKDYDEDKIELINEKVDNIFPYLKGCIVTKKENNGLKMDENFIMGFANSLDEKFSNDESNDQNKAALIDINLLFKTYIESDQNITVYEMTQNGINLEFAKINLPKK
jgi:hypothetical protein